MEQTSLVQLLDFIIQKNERKIELNPCEKFLYLIYIDGMKEHEARDLVQGWYNVQHFSAQTNPRVGKKWDLVF